MSKRALVIGAHGQDGAYLCRHLLLRGYEVHGGVRRWASGERLEKLDIELEELHYCDVTDAESVRSAVARSRPDEIYNLAAQSHVGASWDMPGATLDVNARGALNVFLAMGSAKCFQASAADMFGDQPCPERGFDEATPFRPKTPYGAAKAAAHGLAHAYRAKGQFIACGILFNHESPLRTEAFVTQKIATGIKRWRETGEPFELHSVTGVRDWGWAPEYVEAMHMMLQKDTPDDYVLATGKPASVDEFLQAAIGDTIFVERDRVLLAETGRLVCRVTALDSGRVPRCFGNPAKARSELGWTARTTWSEVAREMARAA